MEHFFLDLYDVNNELLGSESLVKKLADAVVNLFGKGKITMIPYFNGKKAMDGGISCVIIADNFHFTCHTFSFKNTAFIDCFGAGEKKEDLLQTILNIFPTENYDRCLEDRGQGNFSKHLIINDTDFDRTYSSCLELIEQMVKDIEMTKISDVITNFKDESNFDILQVIAESHISLHRLNDKTIVDVFSCKNFDEQKALELVGASPADAFMVSRGIQYRP